jgi:uncharacterized protein with HEPN domain
LSSSRPIDRFSDIIRNIDAIASYIAGMDQNAFLSDSKTCDATERCLSRISEAASKIGLPPRISERSRGNRLEDRHRGFGFAAT